MGAFKKGYQPLPVFNLCLSSHPPNRGATPLLLSKNNGVFKGNTSPIGREGGKKTISQIPLEILLKMG